MPKAACSYAKSFGEMRRFIIDTNLYIDWLNAGKHESIIFQPDAVKFMSTVVMMELLAGDVLRQLQTVHGYHSLSTC